MTFKQELKYDINPNLIFWAVVFAWSTSWVMIKFQIANVPEGLSVSYRFFGASAFLFLIAKISGFSVKFSRAQHRLIFLQGINLFFFNHLFFYSAVHYLSSGIVATSSALGVITIPVIDRIIHKTPLSKKIFIGGIIGILGVLLIALPEMEKNNVDAADLFKGILFCILGVISFSCGSVVGKELKLSNIKTLISSTSYSMFYGASLSFLVAFAVHKELYFDVSFSYIASLIYLIFIPGILGYCAILLLVEKSGSLKASYTALLYPAFALIISGFFEGYNFTLCSFIGIIFVTCGNIIALRSKKIKAEDIKDVV